MRDRELEELKRLRVGYETYDQSDWELSEDEFGSG